PLALDLRARALPDEVAIHGVHATHRLIVHRPLRAGERLRTTASVAALERRAPGAFMVLRMETTDAAGRPVTTTDYGSLYPGVTCDPISLPPGRRAHHAPRPPPPREEGRTRRRRATRAPSAPATGGPPKWRSPPPSPTSTPSARASGTRSTPTARSPAPPDCPTSSCTAPLPLLSRCP